MTDFIKRNAKIVLISGISLFLIAVLTAALIVTNIGTVSARGRDKDRDRGSVRMELTEEERAERAAARREHLEQRLEQRLADGSITQEEYDEYMAAIESGEYPARGGGKGKSKDRDSERTPLTEEQIAERIDKMRDKLAQDLADGKITQEQYDEKIEALDNGEFPSRDRTKGNKTGKSSKDDSASDAG